MNFEITEKEKHILDFLNYGYSNDGIEEIFSGKELMNLF